MRRSLSSFIFLVSALALAQAPPPSGSTPPNQINPANQIKWPMPNCTTGVYQPSSNTCVAPGTAANPAGSTGDVQTNGGGSFSADTGYFTYNPVAHNMNVQNLNGVAYVLPAFTRGGSDVGDEINRAYASLPPTGGLIYIAPNTNGGCYNFSTPIVLAVAGKIPNIVGLGTANGGTTPAAQGGVCLNYTPTTGTAMTLDYMGNFAADVLNSHGMSNILLINNNCHTAGGCGSSAVGLDNGNTNAGMAGATLSAVTIAGFGTGWRNVSFSAGGESQSCEMLWINALFFENRNAIVIENPTGIVFMKGFFSSNGKAIVGNDASAAPEIKMYGTTFAGNQTTPIIDFTATTTTGAGLLTFGVHWETTTLDMNYVAGFINLSSNGDEFETNNKTPGGCTDLVDATLSSNIRIMGAVMAIGGGAGPCPAIVNAEATTVIGQVQGYARGFTTVATGPGAANIQGDVYNDTVSPKIMANRFLGGLTIGSGVSNPLAMRGPATGGMWETWGSGSAPFDTCGTMRSSGGYFCAYNATQTGLGNWVATIATSPVSILIEDNAGLSYYFQFAGTCPTTGTNTFATCFGTAPIFTATRTGLVLSVANASWGAGGGGTNIASSSNVSQYCGVSTLSSGTTGSNVACSFVTTSSHCQASWSGTLPATAVNLGYTIPSAGQVAAVTSAAVSGNVTLHCSGN